MWLKAVDCFWHHKSIWLFGYQTQTLFVVDIIMNGFIWMLFMILDILHKNPVIWHTKIESIIKFFLHQCKCVSIIWWFLIYTASWLKSVGDLWWSNQGIPGRTSDKNVIKIYYITHLPWSGQTSHNYKVIQDVPGWLWRPTRSRLNLTWIKYACKVISIIIRVRC